MGFQQRADAQANFEFGLGIGNDGEQRLEAMRICVDKCHGLLVAALL